MGRPGKLLATVISAGAGIPTAQPPVNLFDVCSSGS